MYTKSGEGEKRKPGESEQASVVFTGKGFRLNLGFRKFCVHRRWIHKNFGFTSKSLMPTCSVFRILARLG